MPLVIDIFATLAFALSGALVASRKRMDIVGFIWLAVITGVGGGTTRDLLLGLPVFWVEDSLAIIVCVAAAIAVYFAGYLIQSRYTLILWMDAVGLALVTIAGAGKGLDAGVGPVVAVIMGIITGSLGGIIRDLLGQEPSIVLRREIYVTAALAGALVYVLLVGIGLGGLPAIFCGFITILAVRGCAIQFGWSLPEPQARDRNKR